MPSPLAEILDIAAVLRAEHLSHALIGGWAVITWGYLRTSDDFDLMVDLPAGKPSRLLKALSERWDAEWIKGDLDDPIQSLIRAKPKIGGLPIDLLAGRGQADRQALARAIQVPIEGVPIPVVAPEDLIAMKLEAGGGQDYEDARRLLVILARKIDTNALADRCRERNVLDLLDLIKPK